MDPSPWEFGWNALTAIGTLAAASAAVWLGWGSRKHTNLLLEADQRKQASLLRVHQPQVYSDPDASAFGPFVGMVASIALENASQETFSEVWLNIEILGGVPANQHETVGLRFLPPSYAHTLTIRYNVVRQTADSAYSTARVSTTFTDARSVRWRLDEGWKLHRSKSDKEGIPENVEIEAGNEDTPVIILTSPSPPEDTES
jgi:hypothetical protein